MTPTDSAPKPNKESTPPNPLAFPLANLRQNSLLHYAAYFLSIGSLVLVIRSGEPKQVESALIAGAISSGSVLSRDWYKARLHPSVENDPNALIQLFSEMLHANRAQLNTSASQLKRVEFLQGDLTDALRDFNDTLRLSPDEIEQSLRALQTQNLTQAFSEFTAPTASTTHVPDSTTVRQSNPFHRAGFDQ